VRRILLSLLAAAGVALFGCGAFAVHATQQFMDDLAPPRQPAHRAQPVDLLRELLPPVGGPPAAAQPWFLVVGDSVSAGLSVDPARFGHNSSWVVDARQSLAASGRSWDVAAFACPGETTSSYATGCPLRFLVPALHGSQRSAALAAIAAHPAGLRQIVVELGANDLVNGRRDHRPTDSVVAGATARLDSVVSELQAAAPGVPVVVANVYNPYPSADRLAATAVARLNQQIAALASAHGDQVADFHAAINSDPGLRCSLIDCRHHDVHPTIAGHQRLAQAVLTAIDAGPGGQLRTGSPALR
jgi:lysophospholipase L1-like esterase